MSFSRLLQPKNLIVLAALGLAGFSLSRGQQPSLAAEDDMPRFFEMRTYIAHDGKLADLQARFRDHTTALFEKHGMVNIGYWVPTDGPEAATTLVYLLAFPSREARDASWKAFIDDPDWKAARDASEKNGPLVAKVISQFLTPTDFSAIR